MCQVKGNTIVADSQALTTVLNQWVEEMRDPKLQAKFIYNSHEYFTSRGLNDDHIREVFTEAGAQMYADNYNCSFTCLCTNSCCITSFSLSLAKVSLKLS